MMTWLTRKRTTASRLAVITCHFNPLGFRRPIANYFRFRESLRGATVFTIEASFSGRFSLPADWKIRANERNILWQKERLLNEALKRLPARFDCVAWIDADLLFMNERWAAETVSKLDHVPVVQLFEHAHHLDADARVNEVYQSIAVKQQTDAKGHGHPGGAWAARRELLDAHGFYDRCITGGGDLIFSDAAFGTENRWLDSQFPKPLLRDMRHWQKLVYRDVRGRVGCVSGDVVHLFHGTRENRQYVDRNAMLRDAEFDPKFDVIERGGLLEWSSEKPALHAAMKAYFTDRKEDE